MGLEPTTFCATGRRSNQLSYARLVVRLGGLLSILQSSATHDFAKLAKTIIWYPGQDLNLRPLAPQANALSS